MAGEMRDGDLEIQIAYLARNELYNKEKPYAADCLLDDIIGAERSNHKFDSTTVIVRSVRNADAFALDVNGFCVIEEKTTLTRNDAYNSQIVRSQYFSELEGILHQHFPEYTRFEFIDHEVRKRDPALPEDIGKKVKYAQPATLPHSDYTVEGLFLRMAHFFPGQEKFYKDKDFDLLKSGIPM